VAAAQAALRHRGSPTGQRRYPHHYGNFELLTGWNANCNVALFNEFPLISGGVYTGGGPGADRVVVEWAGSDVRYCGAITQTGAPTGEICCVFANVRNHP
jgi:hypothetical protein